MKTRSLTFSRPLALRLLVLIVGLPLLLVSAGCATLPTGLNFSLSPAPIELTIRQVEPSGRPGIYAIAGSTTLPDQSQVTVSAIRYLEDSAQLSSDSSPLYSILDRQFAEVTQGNWETELNLWQVAPDGKFREAWQLSQQEVGVALDPDSTVTFSVTLDPSNQPANLRDQVESQDESVQAALARFTTDGELYLQASKTLNVALPTGSTTPPAQPANATRPSSPQTTSASSSDTTDSSSTSWTQTNAPLTSDQFFR